MLFKRALPLILALFAARGIVLADEPIDWRECKTLGVEGQGWTDTLAPYDRLPGGAKDQVPAPVWNLSHHSAGLCLRFTTDAPKVQFRWTLIDSSLSLPHMPSTGVSGLDLYVKEPGGRWRFVVNCPPKAASNTSKEIGVSPGQQYLLYFPLYNGVKSVQIGVAEGKKVSVCRMASRPVVFYGTSITHGACASRPGMAFTAIVGRRLDAPVINLGFSGNGRMEPALADLLAELDPSVYVLDCLWNMTPQQVAERVEPFVKKLREAHPDTPILLAEDCNFRDLSPTPNGKALRNVFGKLKSEGVRHVYFLDNKGMLGDDCEGTVDGCHPNDLGMMRMADAFTKALTPLVQPAKP